MTSHKEKYVLLDKETIDSCLKELGSLLKKRLRNKSSRCELIIVGGASILLNYGFRLTTTDIDCSDEYKILMNDLVSEIAEKHNLPTDWINTSFVNTKSYSPKLSQYSVHYKTFGNGVLEVRTIKDIYLLAMKIVSGRKYKNDYSDIYGIINEYHKRKEMISVEMIEKAIIDLYGSISAANKQAFTFAKSIIANPEAFDYDSVKNNENSNLEIIKNQDNNSLNEEDIDYILSKLVL